MQYIERISAILMPWAALGWMLGFTVLALRRGGWKYPALFALVVALAGGTNATSLIYVGIGPVIWVLYALLGHAGLLDRPRPHEHAEDRPALARRLAVVDRRPARRRQLRHRRPQVHRDGSGHRRPGYGFRGDARPRILVLLRERPPRAVAVVRRRVHPAGRPRRRELLLAGTRRVSEPPSPVGELGAYFAFVGLVGLVLSVGTHPYTGPSLIGGALKEFMTETTAGFALRSTDRATPLVVLALAALLGSGLTAFAGRLASWRPELRFAALVPAAMCVALAIVDAGPLMTGLAVDPNFERPSNIPSYFDAAAKYLDAQGDSTRVLIEPGDDFADYDLGQHDRPGVAWHLDEALDPAPAAPGRVGGHRRPAVRLRPHAPAGHL